MVLAPDGRTFATFENLSGDSEGDLKRAASLWDVQTGQYRPLADFDNPAGLVLLTRAGEPSGAVRAFVNIALS